MKDVQVLLSSVQVGPPRDEFVGILTTSVSTVNLFISLHLQLQ